MWGGVFEKYRIWVSIFIRGVTNKYPWLHFAFPYPISSKLHSLPFPRISQNTTWLRLVVFWLILGNGNSCNFARYPTRYVKNTTRLRLVEFLTYLVGYLENTPRTNFKSPKYPSAAPRGILEIWNWSSGYFFEIFPELNFARDISNKNNAKIGDGDLGQKKLVIWAQKSWWFGDSRGGLVPPPF